MAVDKLVDSTQLDADLTSVADAIRAKTGGTADLAFPADFVSEIGSISGGDTVYYSPYGQAYIKNMVFPSNITVIPAMLREAHNLETLVSEGGSTGSNTVIWNCQGVKTLSFPARTTYYNYFIRQDVNSKHSLESITLGSIGYPVTTLGTVRWFYGDCANGCTITIYVDATTIADIPSAVTDYAIGNGHPSGYAINVVYKNSTTGEVLTA